MKAENIIGGILAIVCSVLLISFAILVLLFSSYAIITVNIFELVMHLFVFGGFMYSGVEMVIIGIDRLDEGMERK